eukprot:CAMPEP_0119156522 /NCGR_PEP_ID=MMETSP1310-20130426/52298_1 /TAXON_ID=464262 /ORGANISM="Genus nov. species nov., Strain RCC2339" /LENGTH=451 /DNA_ID=CAMNT_0007149135 /DNA_START=433 /DNA_END=1785 /DNA_ORIENTATION=-
MSSRSEEEEGKGWVKTKCAVLPESGPEHAVPQQGHPIGYHYGGPPGGGYHPPAYGRYPQGPPPGSYGGPPPPGYQAYSSHGYHGGYPPPYSDPSYGPPHHYDPNHGYYYYPPAPRGYSGGGLPHGYGGARSPNRNEGPPPHGFGRRGSPHGHGQPPPGYRREGPPPGTGYAPQSGGPPHGGAGSSGGWGGPAAPPPYQHHRPSPPAPSHQTPSHHAAQRSAPPGKGGGPAGYQVSRRVELRLRGKDLSNHTRGLLQGTINPAVEIYVKKTIKSHSTSSAGSAVDSVFGMLKKAANSVSHGGTLGWTRVVSTGSQRSTRDPAYETVSFTLDGICEEDNPKIRIKVRDDRSSRGDTRIGYANGYLSELLNGSRFRLRFLKRHAGGSHWTRKGSIYATHVRTTFGKLSPVLPPGASQKQHRRVRRVRYDDGDDGNWDNGSDNSSEGDSGDCDTG